jgi:hypothetical protein
MFSMKVGTELTLDRPLVTCEGKPLLKLNGAPLVTLVNNPKGGRVIYLNFCAPERYETDSSDSARLLRAVMEAITRQSQILPLAEGAPTWSCARYDLDRGHAYFLVDRTQSKQPRFTEETGSMDPAAKLSLRLEPKTQYRIYDVLADSVSRRQTNDKGHLELFLSGRSIRLLYVFREDTTARLLFTTAERDDKLPRGHLPAKLHVHRSGKAVISGVPEGATIYLNRKAASVLDTALADSKTVVLPKGNHLLEVR